MAKNNIIKYQSELNRPLILDGAIGSYLQMIEEHSHPVLWSSYLNVTKPELIIKLHKEYISAGAEIITTNTFRTNPAAFENVGLNITNSEFVKGSVKLAKIAAGGNESLFIAGSNPPAEDSYQIERKLSNKQIETNHKFHINMLWDSGCDFTLNETQSHFDEIKIICQHCSANSIPFVISLFITPDLRILSGEHVVDIIDYIRDFSPIAIGINCVYPNIFEHFCNKISIDYRWGFYLNCGSGNYSDNDIYEGVSPNGYKEIVKDNISGKPFFIGSCCGSNPMHTKSIKDYINASSNN